MIIMFDILCVNYNYYYYYVGEDDFHDVYQEVFTLAPNYYKLGVGLGLPVTELNKVKKGYSQDLDQAFSEILLIWLRHSYDTHRHGAPTWQRLVEAIDNPAACNSHALAIKIASNHPTGINIIL